MKTIQRLLFPVLFSFSLLSCSKEDNNSNDELKLAKEYTYSVMTDIYYWYKDVPGNINPDPIKTLENYFDTLLVAKDRWSWMMKGEEYLSMESGVYKIFGASFAQPIDHYNDYSIRVKFVFDNSPMSENGVKRGYELTHLSGTSVSTLIQNGTINSALARESNTFTFKDYSGKSFSFSASAREVSTRSVLKSMVITPSDYPGLQNNVGYINYYTFNQNMTSDIDNAIDLFRSANIKELILDLRYNGGGDGDALEYLADLISPEQANGQVLGKRKHNDRYSQYDNNASTMTVISRKSNALSLNRIFILTSGATASASEVLINGLDPIMNIIQLGKRTYGKPNGMYVIPYPANNYTSPKYVLLPICFYTVNKNGFGDYESGINPDHTRPDDLYHDFGPQEDWISSCLSYIVNGTFPALPSVTFQTKSGSANGVIQRDEEKPGYGKLIYKF